MNQYVAPVQTPGPGPAVQPPRPVKFRPFSFGWGALFFVIGVTGFTSDAFGLTLGAALSVAIVLASCCLLGMIFWVRRLRLAALVAPVPVLMPHPSAPVAPPPSTEEHQLFMEALAELDHIDQTVATDPALLDEDQPSHVATDEPDDDATGSESTS